MKSIMLCAIAALTACGGRASEEDRELNWQNRQAGEFIEQMSSDPAVQQAGRDVKMNSEQLAAAPIGEPKVKKAYSRDESAKAREASKKSHEGGGTFWAIVWGGVGVITTLLGIPAIRTLAPTFFTGTVGKAAMATWEAISTFKAEKVKDGKATFEVDDLIARAKKLQEDERVQPVVKKIVKKIEKRKGLKTDAPALANVPPATS